MAVFSSPSSALRVSYAATAAAESGAERGLDRSNYLWWTPCPHSNLNCRQEHAVFDVCSVVLTGYLNEVYLLSVNERRIWSASGRNEVKSDNDFVSQAKVKASRRNPERARQYWSGNIVGE